MADVVRIANTCAFWGDDIEASARTIAQDPNIDYLTLDYLAEVSMSILAKLKQRDPQAGYAADFLEVIASLIPAWKAGGKFKLITNAGGLNPQGCGRACAKLLRDAQLTGMKVAMVSGDDVLPAIVARPLATVFNHLESGLSIASEMDRIVTANAYIGAAPIVDALHRDADIVMTGRVADPSLTVAPCIVHFGWDETEFDKLAGATVAGHLIECGTQVTGGISTDWMQINATNVGFPIVEVSADGSCIVTKSAGTGGAVNEWTVKEQLLYELGDPGQYLSPDVTASFLTLAVEDLGHDRVRVRGATGQPPPTTLKVSATLRAGYRASATLTIAGRDAVAKARRAGEIVLQKLRDAGKAPSKFNIECLGSGDVAPGVLPRRDDLTETVLRLTASDPDRAVVERFAKMLVPLVTAGPQGTTGYFDGRPTVREVFEYWPCLIDRSLVRPKVEIVNS
jgi:hypothetical protein